MRFGIRGHICSIFMRAFKEWMRPSLWSTFHPSKTEIPSYINSKDLQYTLLLLFSPLDTAAGSLNWISKTCLCDALWIASQLRCLSEERRIQYLSAVTAHELNPFDSVDFLKHSSKRCVSIADRSSGQSVTIVLFVLSQIIHTHKTVFPCLNPLHRYSDRIAVTVMFVTTWIIHTETAEEVL